MKRSGRKKYLTIGFKNWLRIVVASAVLMLMVFNSCQVTPESGTIKGNVTDTEGAFLEGVRVYTEPASKSAVTNSSGDYTINGVEIVDEVYTVIAEKEGYITSRANAAVKMDEEIVVNLALQESIPMIAANPFFIDFGNNETTRTLTIENSGNDVVHWRLLTEDSWITSISADSGMTTSNGGESTITLTADRTGLPNGVTTGCMEVVSAVDTLKVGLQISKGAIIELSRRHLAFGSTDSLKTFTIKDAEDGQLTFTLDASQSWLSATPISRTITEETDITVSVDRTGEDFGTHYGQITFESNGGRDTVFVAMTVANPNAPQIFVPVTELNFSNNVSNYDLRLGNSGTGNLSWTVQEDVPWLETGLQSGVIASGGTVSLPIIVNRSGLSSTDNPYVGELKIVSSDPAMPEVVLPLTMLVDDLPVLSISHPIIDLGLTGDTWNLAIGNSGAGMLSWEADPVDSWIAMTPRNGGNATSVELRVNRNNAGFGDVTGTVEVISNGGTQQILVLLENRGNNTAPQSDFTVAPETGRLETIFNFDASITTDDYDPLDSLEFSWRWEASGDFTDWSSSPTATHQYTSTGNKQVTVNVRDTNGATRTKARTVQVVANTAPVVNFTFDPPSGTTSDVFTFNAGSTTDDVDPIDSLRFRWKFGSGATFTEWSSDSIITHQFTDNANHQVTLEVIDSDSAIGIRNRTVAVSQNPAPVANFSIDPASGTTTTVFRFDAGLSSDNRDPIDSLLFRWRWEDGEPWTDWTHDTLASHQYATNGNKQVTLQVEDQDGAIGERTKSVNVSQNPAPNTNFSIDPPSGTTTTVFQFNAGLTSDDTDPIELLKFRWLFEVGGIWTDWSSDTLATYQYTTNGNKTVTLEAQDQAGAIGSRSKTVSVSSNPAPTAVFTFDPPTGTPAMMFTFNAGGSSDDTDPIESLQFRWEFGSGSGFTSWSSDTVITHMFSTAGDQQVTLQVMDLAGAVGEDQQTIPVVQNQSPNAAFGFTPPNGTVMTTFEFDASASTDDFTDLADLEFRWRWTANSGFTNWMNTPLASHVYSSTGFKEVTLEVRDAEGSVGNATATIEVVENQPPNALFNVTPEVGTTATLFQFDASASTDDVYPLDSLMFRWRWENGGPFTDWSSSPTAEHQYSTDGQKTVKLEVLDPGGLVGSVSDLVLVGAPPVSENEPNDSRQQANPAGHTATVFGEIGVAGDEDDWFAVTAPANGKLWYRITNLEANGTPDSRIEESPLFAINEQLDAVEITSAFVSHGGSRYIGPGEAATSKKTIVSANRIYYIQIPQYTGHSAQYELRMFFSDLNQSDLGEDNDDQVSAFTIAANQFHQARNGFWKNGATKEDQQDWYELQFNESGVLQYTVENLHNESVANGYVDETIFYGATTFDFIELTRAAVSHGSNRYIGETEIATSGKVGIDKGRSFFLQIPQYVNHAAPYEFQVNFVPSSFTDFGESNDQSTTATSISDNGENTAQIGYVVSSGQYDEKDWYKPQISTNGLLQITIENLYSNDILNGRIAPSKIYLKNILDFNEIETLQINHGGSNNYIGAGETVVSSLIAVSTAEEYFLEVPQYLADRHQAPYKLKTAIFPIPVTGVPDFNNTSGSADTIQVNTIINASIGYEDDGDDWYLFFAPASGSFQFSVENNHVSGVIGGRIATCLMYNNVLQVIGSATVNHGGNNNYIDAAETGTSDVVQVVGGTAYYLRIPRNDQDVAPYTLQTSFSQ